jgi:anthranilate phosphoribosyltransferase
VRLDAPAEVVAACVREAGIGFLFAPTFHRALGGLTPIRRALGFRTIFNVLGPLANPALVERTLVGVAQARLLEPMSHVLHARGIRHAILVSADDGLDELSLDAPSSIYTVTPDGVVASRIDAGQLLGLRHGAASLRGGGVADNVAAVRRFVAAAPGPVFDVACANAALALIVAGHAATLDQGFDLASASVREGRAARALERLVAVSNS